MDVFGNDVLTYELSGKLTMFCTTDVISSLFFVMYSS
jgi:hypothetical protein